MTFWAQSKKQCMVKISYWNTINFKINTGKPCIRNSYKFNNTGLSKVANLNNWAGQDFSLKRYSIIKFRISICCVLMTVTWTTHVSFCQLLKHRGPAQHSWHHTVSPARVRLIPPPSTYPRLSSTWDTSIQPG